MQLQIGNPEHLALYQQFCADIKRYSLDENSLRALCKEHGWGTDYQKFYNYRFANFKKKNLYFSAIHKFATEIVRRVFEQKNGWSILAPSPLPF